MGQNTDSPEFYEKYDEGDPRIKLYGNDNYWRF